MNMSESRHQVPEESLSAASQIVLSEDLFDQGSTWSVLFKELHVDLEGRVRPSHILDQSIRPVSSVGIRRPELPELAQKGLLTARQILAASFEEIAALNKSGNVVDAVTYFIARLAFTPHAILLSEVKGVPSDLYPLPVSAEDEQRHAVEEVVRSSVRSQHWEGVYRTISLRYGFADGIARTPGEIAHIHPLPRERITGQMSDVKRYLAQGKMVRGYIALSPHNLTRLIWPDRVFWKDVPFQTHNFNRITLDDFNLTKVTRNELRRKAPEIERLSTLVLHVFATSSLSQVALEELRTVLTQLPHTLQPPPFIPEQDIDIHFVDDHFDEDEELDNFDK